jgi:hypothetical protein
MAAYLGYRDGDADTPWGSFFNPEMAPLPRHVVTALEHGPQADQTLLEFDDAATLLDEGYQQTENGYGRLRDGGLQVSARTDMPGVTPAMWDWWFGWHGSDSRRYKLWHPRAHVSARWRDGRGDGGYVGRTSMVQEYLGSAFSRPAIQFGRRSRRGDLCSPRLGRHPGRHRVARAPRAAHPVGRRDAIEVLDGRPARADASCKVVGG